MRSFKGLAAIILAYVLCLSLVSRGQARGGDGREGTQDSLVVLLSAKSAQMLDIDGVSYRKVVGPARFLHNGTFLLCDTALWNVDTKVIDAWGNVSILQDETVLTSDKLTYLVDDNLAQFRGSVVELTDKDHNTLRTRHLDYDTADSVAVFQGGGAMRDKDGQIIESMRGTYDSKINTFVFTDDVNMFTDSVFVKTISLKYESDINLATFGRATDVWKDENMLSSGNGWYDRSREVFFFSERVHVMSEEQEGWCDSLFFWRNTADVEMLGNAQITDTTRNVFGLAGRIQYFDSSSKVTMTRKPAVISQTDSGNGVVDTVYLGANKLVYYTLRMCDVDSMDVVAAAKRLEDLKVDPVGTFRKKAAEEAAKAAAEAAKDDPNYRPASSPSSGKATGKTSLGQTGKAEGKQSGAPVSAAKPSDKDSVMPSDSLAMPGDTLGTSDSLSSAGFPVEPVVEVKEPEDTSKVGFLEAISNVKIYKKDMQVSCDSLVYCDLDSLAQFFRDPIIWQDANRQYTADSIYVSVSGGTMDKVMLMSDAFITIQEDSLHFDQIKGTEMMAYFDGNGGLRRFDVLGGASALFYIEENDALATVNKTDSKMLSATFKDGELQRIYYFEEAKNDGYPVVRLSREERLLKGFRWDPAKRPADRSSVTPLSLRPSERKRYAARPRASFMQTDIYFPGYMNDVYRQIQVRDSLRKIREAERLAAEREAAARERLDSIARADSLAMADSLASGIGKDIVDSLNVRQGSDSLSVSDTSAFVKVLSAKEQKAADKALKKKLRQEAQEAKWKKLDERDAEKARIKEEKRLAKERKRKRKALQDAARQAEKDARTIEKYRMKYERQKARKDARAAKNQVLLSN